MAKFWSKDIRVYLGGYDISQSQVRLAVTMGSQALDRTSFPDAAERVLPGLRQDGFEWAGIFDDSATGATADMYAAATAVLGTATAGTLVTVLVGTGAGSVAFVGTALLNAKRVGGPLNDLVRLEADFGVDGSWQVAKSFGGGSLMANNDASGSIDNGTLTTAGGTLYVHVLGGNGTTAPQMRLLDSADATTWAAVGTGSISPQNRAGTLIIYTGTIRRYVEAQAFGGTGSANYQVSFLRS